MNVLLSMLLMGFVPGPETPVDPPPASASPAEEIWPPAVTRLTAVRAPDWSDHRIYPLAARVRHQEGLVGFELWVGRDGVPRACRIRTSSGHSELDAGTCDLALQIRFAPPVGADGSPAEVTFGLQIDWMLAEPISFGASRMTADLTLNAGEIVGCDLEFAGPVPREWKRTACRIFARWGRYYLHSVEPSARHVTIAVELQPVGEAPVQGAPLIGRAVAMRRTEFELDRRGDLRNCRTPIDQGFGIPSVDHSSACGFFLVNAWMRPGRAPGSPHSGTFILAVYVDSEDSDPPGG